jgi:hypothetical protein
VEAAVDQCEKTLRTKAEVTPERIAGLIEKFGVYGITKKQIEQRIQRRIDAITPALLVSLGKIYNSLKDGMSTAADWFEPEPGTDGEKPKAGTEGFKSKLQNKAQERKEPEAPPMPEPEPQNSEEPQPAAQNQAEAASSPEMATNVPEEDKDPAREEYINLRSAGFSTWVYKNKGRITSDEFTDEHRREIEEKWGKLYPNDPYPLAVTAQAEAPGHHGKMGDWRTDDAVWEAMLTDAEETLGHALFTKAVYEFKLEKHLTKSPDPVTLRGADRELLAKKLNAQMANI